MFDRINVCESVEHQEFVEPATKNANEKQRGKRDYRYGTSSQEWIKIVCLLQISADDNTVTIIRLTWWIIQYKYKYLLNHCAMATLKSRTSQDNKEKQSNKPSESLESNKLNKFANEYNAVQVEVKESKSLAENLIENKKD